MKKMNQITTTNQTDKQRLRYRSLFSFSKSTSAGSRASAPLRG